MSRTEDKTYSSLSEVPGTMVERHAVEDERFTAGALYNLAGSSTGVSSILAADNAVLGMACFALITTQSMFCACPACCTLMAITAFDRPTANNVIAPALPICAHDEHHCMQLYLTSLHLMR